MILTSEKTHRWLTFRTKRCEAGFVMTLWEVLIAVVIVAVVFGLIFDGYVTSAKMAQWTGFSLAAQSMSGQAIEQARSAKWDIADGTVEVLGMNLLNKQIVTNGVNWTMTGYTTNVLDIPWKGTNYVMATNFITVTSFFQNGVSNPWVQMQSVMVQTVWPFDGWGNFTLKYYTNTEFTLIAPDNRNPQTLGE